MTTPGGQLVVGERLAAFRQLYRWFNLTLIHQATWPLVLLLTAAPRGTPKDIPLPWYLARLAGPAVAAVLALLYLSQPPLPKPADRTGVRSEGAPPPPPARSPLVIQARFIVLGLPVMVALARLAVGPVAPAARLILYGIADVAAFQLIHFGVVARSYPDPVQGRAFATLLFAVSWGMRDAMLAALGSRGASSMLAFVSGLVLGLAIALLSRGLRRWPGGFWPAAATHLLLVYLIVGFVA